MQAKIQALQTLLLTFDIPQSRRDLSKPTNVHWLLRNLFIQNGGHKEIDLALRCLKDLALMAPTASLN